MVSKNNVTEVLELNESLKHLNRQAERISLIALNAMLMARKESCTQNGFSRVTTELRKFCSNLTVRTELLSGYIFRIVNQMSELEKQANNLRIISETALKSQKCSNTLGNPQVMLEVQQRLIDELTRELTDTKAELMVELNRTIKQSMSGENLGVLAKVESQKSSVGGALSLIADQVYDTVNEIQHSLKQATYSVA